MTLLTIPPSRAPLTMGNGLIAPDWYRFLHDLSERAGGVNGLSTGDVDAGSFAAMQPFVSQSETGPEVMQASGSTEAYQDVMQAAACCLSEIYPMQD